MNETSNRWGVMGCCEIRNGLGVGCAGQACPMCRRRPCCENCAFMVEVKLYVGHLRSKCFFFYSSVALSSFFFVVRR